MGKRVQLRRLSCLALLLLLAMVALGYRLVDLQVLRHQELSLKAQQNTQHEFLLEPRRGDILDAKGNLLATSVFVKSVCADPALLAGHQAEFAHLLAPLLQTNETKLLELLSPRISLNQKGQPVTNRYICLKKKVPLETWDQITNALAHLSFGVDEKKLPKEQRPYYTALRKTAIFATEDQLRSYPNQRLASHVLGFTLTQEKEVDEFPVTETFGRDGIEQTFNAKLAGARGWRMTELDKRRREVLTLREQDVEPHDGLNVVLTIDSVIQHIVESALAEAMEKHSPDNVSGIVVRPRTGEILALASLPDYDPNNYGHFSDAERRNRVIADAAEPGSTFKIVVVSGALNEGVVRPTDTFDCEHGHFYYAGKTLHDHNGYGTLTVENIIAKSSNIGAAKVGIKLGENRLYDYICRFGFGSISGLPLPGESSASWGVPKPGTQRWSKLSIARIPMGQGIAVTRMQMLMAMCAIANQGYLMQPMLVDRLEDSQHNVVAKYSPQRVRQVISEQTARQMVQALKAVVSPDGTAPRAALEHYTVAGKTGTANKAGPGGYTDKFFSSFIGFFPADNPELCISITFDDPKHGHFGGDIAAPVFKQIAERAANYLNIRPEDGVGPMLPVPVSGPQDSLPLKTAAAPSQ